jgi:1,4-dihydroxy-2-naphthoyl-CoA hydrolase
MKQRGSPAHHFLWMAASRLIEMSPTPNPSDKSAKNLERIAAQQLRRRLQENSTSKQMGFRLIKASRGRVQLRMKVDSRHLQAHGVVHGGVLAALADTSGGLATYMACPLGTRVATIEMKINYLEGVERGSVTSDAKVVRIGRHIAVVDCDVTDDAGRLVAKALMTFFVGPFAQSSARPTGKNI